MSECASVHTHNGYLSKLAQEITEKHVTSFMLNTVKTQALQTSGEPNEDARYFRSSETERS